MAFEPCNVRLLLGARMKIAATLEAIRSDRFAVRLAGEPADKLPKTGDFWLELPGGEISGRIRLGRIARSGDGAALLLLTITGFDEGSEQLYRDALHRALSTPGGTGRVPAAAAETSRRLTRHHFDFESRFTR
jgi:hypothetical protein